MGVCKGLGIMTIDLNIVTRFYRRRWILFVLFVTVMSEKPKKKKKSASVCFSEERMHFLNIWLCCCGYRCLRPWQTSAYLENSHFLESFT